MKHCKIAIIGSGPAGMSCAIQLKRMGLDPVIFEREEPASMLRMANKVENYLGFPDGIRGEELFHLFREQMERFRVECIYKEVKRTFLDEDIFIVETEDDAISCSILVVATGTRPVRTIIPTWDEAVKEFLHYDISRVPKHGDLSVGIIGLGDAAFDYALNLHQRGHQVTIFGRSEKVMANQSLMEQFRKVSGIGLCLNHILVSVEESVDGKIHCRFRNNEHQVDVNLNCIIFATGREAALDFLDESTLEQMDLLMEKGRLYLAGDVKNGDFRQTAIATADGIRTAMEIFQHEGITEDGA